MKTFHMLLPPLIINYVDHMVSAKERMNKTKKGGTATTAAGETTGGGAKFTDDGFAMGK